MSSTPTQNPNTQIRIQRSQHSKSNQNLTFHQNKFHQRLRQKKPENYRNPGAKHTGHPSSLLSGANATIAASWPSSTPRKENGNKPKLPVTESLRFRPRKSRSESNQRSELFFRLGSAPGPECWEGGDELRRGTMEGAGVSVMLLRLLGFLEM